VPNRTGETISTTSSARPRSSTVDVSVGHGAERIGIRAAQKWPAGSGSACP
jgi:hypothetical protein